MLRLPGGFGNRFRHAMGGKHDGRVGLGDLVEVVDEDRALGAQAFDHVSVVDDLVAHIDRRTVQRQRPFHGVDGAHHAGAESARRAQKHGQLRLGAGLALIGPN